MDRFGGHSTAGEQAQAHHEGKKEGLGEKIKDMFQGKPKGSS